MAQIDRFGDVALCVDEDFVATAEIQRPPHNYFDGALIGSLADANEALDADDRCRAIVLCSEGKNFCAGGADPTRPSASAELFSENANDFSTGPRYASPATSTYG